MPELSVHETKDFKGSKGNLKFPQDSWTGDCRTMESLASSLSYAYVERMQFPPAWGVAHWPGARE
jgi:hypothetical protein